MAKTTLVQVKKALKDCEQRELKYHQSNIDKLDYVKTHKDLQEFMEWSGEENYKLKYYNDKFKRISMKYVLSNQDVLKKMMESGDSSIMEIELDQKQVEKLSQGDASILSVLFEKSKKDKEKKDFKYIG